MSTEVRIPVGRPDRSYSTRLTPRAVRIRVFASIVLLLVSLPKPVRAGDPYLDAINAEGNRLETLGQARKEQELLMRGTTPATVAPAANRTPGPALNARPAGGGTNPGANAAMDFENVLRDNFPGSYALYAALDSKEKESVFNEYQKSRSDGPGRFLPVVSRIITLTTIRNRDRRAPGH